MFADLIVKIFGFGFSETNALHLFLDTLAKIFSQANFNKFISSLLVLVECFCTFMFGMPMSPRGEALDLTGYECVFVDEFEGDKLDTDVWYYRGEGVCSYRDGSNSSDAVSLRDGNLVIKQFYDENGKFGPDWYAATVALKQKYLRGYFEIRCICNDDPDFWSAFWMQADAPYTPEISKGGIGGAEIDIFESLNNGNIWRHNSVSTNIHCSGMEGDTSGGLNSLSLGSFKANKPYSTYNTYGFEWTEDESKTSEFIIDYIKIYQKEDAINE